MQCTPVVYLWTLDECSEKQKPHRNLDFSLVYVWMIEFVLLRISMFRTKDNCPFLLNKHIFFVISDDCVWMLCGGLEFLLGIAMNKHFSTFSVFYEFSLENGIFIFMVIAWIFQTHSLGYAKKIYGQKIVAWCSNS